MRIQMKKTLKNLRANNFAVHFAESSEVACKTMLNMISKDAVVDIGDSATVRQIGIPKELEKIGTKTLNPFSRRRARIRIELVMKADSHCLFLHA